jgi:DNA invertase Pin-like site-specific DNA recombinase
MNNFMGNTALVLDPSSGVPGAAYVRFSSDLQSETSSIDQTQRCRDAAARQGCVIPDHLVFRDDAISGRFMKNRPNLQRLLAMAKLKPAPFVTLFIDSSSRLGRNLSEVLQLAKILKHNGIYLHIASTGLDSRNPAFEMVLTMMGMMDEVFVSELSARVRGAMHGQVRRGYHPSGKCYGYKNVREENYERREVRGHAPTKGVRQVIDVEEAATVRLIFQMYADGSSYGRIAKFLNDSGVLSSGHHRKGGVRWWHPGAIATMLVNERYIGTVTFGKTQKVKNPETGATENRFLAESSWTTQYHEEMRIISEELWEAVKLQHGRVLDKHGPKTLGGMNRTEGSRRYLFSGLLRCGMLSESGEACNANMVVVKSSVPYVYYGCPIHRKGGDCMNKLLIRQSSLEEQLVGAIVASLRAPESLAQLRQEFTRQLEQAGKEESATAEQALGNHDVLRKESATLNRTIENLAAAIAEHGLSHALSAKLRQSEVRIEEITRLLAIKDKPASQKISIEKTEEFLNCKVDKLVEVLLGDPARTKQELMTRIDKLVLTPEVRDGKDVYLVQGDVRLFAANEEVMLTGSATRTGQHYPKPRISLNGVVLLPNIADKKWFRKGGRLATASVPPCLDRSASLATVVRIAPKKTCTPDQPVSGVELSTQFPAWMEAQAA